MLQSKILHLQPQTILSDNYDVLQDGCYWIQYKPNIFMLTTLNTLCDNYKM